MRRARIFGVINAVTEARYLLLLRQHTTDVLNRVRLARVELNLGPKDHFAIQTLQPVEIQKDGTLKDLGDPVAVE